MINEIIPVIHLLSEQQVRTNIEICKLFGLNKVFLINHGYGIEAVVELTNVLYKMKQEFPTLWIGVNFLQLKNSDALKYASSYKVDALWCDNAELIHNEDDSCAVSFKLQLDSLEDSIEYFGGIEFKYQKQPYKHELDWVYNRANTLVDVITTSGEGTGQEIDINKLKRIRETIGESKKLAVASGINYENIKSIAKYANYLMVASSITDRKSEIINIEKLEELLNQLN